MTDATDVNVKEQLAGLQRGLGRIEGKFDLVLVGMNERERNNKNMDSRLRTVEQSQSRTTGRASVWGGLVGAVAGVVGSWLMHH